MLFLNLFEDNFSIDSKFFDFIRCDLKNSTLKEEEVERFEHIINNVEKHVLSKKWRVDFINQLSNTEDILKLISNPSFFIVQTLVRVWLNY
jgi:hypothetical protein